MNSNDPPAQEDVQEIITPLPLPSQLPVVNLPRRSTAGTNPTVLQGNSAGLIVNSTNVQNSPRSASFVLPPSVIINQKQ
ncbi:hypothetical protein BH23THE1_BH23THE1_34140 [soil metagenome]